MSALTSDVNVRHHEVDLARVSRDLAFALDLAETADALTMKWFRWSGLRRNRKLDGSYASEADVAVETALRARIRDERSGEGVLGEESGGAGPTAARWIIDPIDGTKDYIRGVPLWATLIAFERQGELVCAVASAPALRRRWWAARARGAFADGRRMSVSTVSELSDACVAVQPTPDGRAHALARRAWHVPPVTDRLAHLLVAEGAIDVAVDFVKEVWDNAALQLIVEEAGGRFTDVRGTATMAGGSATSTNGRLHEQVVAALAER